jgi:GNAT superfamily N-acetyltransferase
MMELVENNIKTGVAGAALEKIVPVNSQNIDACVSVYMKAYNCPPWNYRWTYDKAKQYLLEYKGCPQFVGFALYDNDVLVGAAFAHTKTWWTNDQLMIDEFFVSQENQGRGYGRKLLAFFDRYCLENQIGSIVLMTNKYMPSYPFYEKNGYTGIDPYVFMFKQVPLD